MGRTNQTGAPSVSEDPRIAFRVIDPADYARYGIDPKDVPFGTYAAQDHPSFLISRHGGNAYGFGLVEQTKLSKADFDFLQSLDLTDPQEIARHAERINAIYKKLGLLIRFSREGSRYFLIPINLVAQSIQDIKTKADEIERIILEHVKETGTERLDIGLMTLPSDLISHELAARLSNHRLFIIDSLDKVRSWRIGLDVVIFPRDPFEYLLDQPLPKPVKRLPRQQRMLNYAAYLAGKIHDLMERDGILLVVGNCVFCNEDPQDYRVEFETVEERKKFLLFSHLYKTHRRYESSNGTLDVHPLDLHFFLHQQDLNSSHLKELTGGKPLQDISLEEIDRLPRLDRPLPHRYRNLSEPAWEKVFSAYFETQLVHSKSTESQESHWKQKVRTDRPLPHNLALYLGKPKQPSATLSELEEEIRRQGLLGCQLPLVAAYRNSFHFIYNVFQTLHQIREGDFVKIREVERDRLINPFRRKRTGSRDLQAVLRLLRQIKRLKQIEDYLNPDQIEGDSTPVLENIEKLSLHGFNKTQLKELVSTVVGHSSMSRVVFGKMPARSLKPLTDMAATQDPLEALETLRVCRLMTVAEIAAALGEHFTAEQAQEVFRVYNDAVQVATQPRLDWDMLEDVRISELGGVQNKALREMLKFFNLFEFLNNWQEFLDRGPHEKEVLCDYNPERLKKLDKVLTLAHTANLFRARFREDPIPRQTFFFRQFLKTEFHGTGHLFPNLGPEAGFRLLWVAVSVSQHKIVNFNPIFASVQPDKRPERLEKIRKTLLQLPPESVNTDYLESIRAHLAQGRPAFIKHTGIRLIQNPTTRATDVSYVDVHENMVRMEELLVHFENRRLHDIALKDVQELERLFAELESYNVYLCQGYCEEPDGQSRETDRAVPISRRLESIKERIRHVFLSQIFVPEEIYDTVELLVDHCPTLLQFLLPEFHTLSRFIENWPTRKKQSVGTYVMRCLHKFQALITKDRDSFQDQNTFYQLAKLEFGPLAEEDIGVKHHQLETLEHLVERLQQRPLLYQAFTLALLFQDLGKMESYAEEEEVLRHIWTHAQRSAHILEHRAILDQYGLDEPLQHLILELVRHHGAIGHVIQGAEPASALEHLSAEKDDRLLDAYVLHCVLAAAAVEEGLMTEDLLDLFLEYRHEALHIIKSGGTWEGHLHDVLAEKGRALVHDPQAVPPEICFLLNVDGTSCLFLDEKDRDEEVWRGRQIAAFERLLRLLEIQWVDFKDLQMFHMNLPVPFIYHQKGLKSIGLPHFTRALERAANALQILRSLEPEVCCYLLHCLDPLGKALRVYDFHPLTRYLSVEESIKLLVMGLHSYHLLIEDTPARGLVSFRPLSQSAKRKQEALKNILKGFSPEAILRAPMTEGSHRRLLDGLLFETSPYGPGVRIGFRDTLHVDSLIGDLRSARTHEELRSKYRFHVKELQRVPYDTAEQLEILKQAYQEHFRAISQKILEGFQRRLADVKEFSELDRIQADMERTIQESALSEDHVFLLQELFDFHRSRVRDEFLTRVSVTINALDDPEALDAYWQDLKKELFRFRHHVGKEYEFMIAAYIDDKSMKVPN
ncbi:hypothetical protein SAMN02746041_01755 [Desulfacinum hydrothermale DSM 13146]|uniref:Uncharacterized protein n=1 Tax=Desulfacinum hydrothermale DSM 13146 TaxID=1121390 RepID=A0A1W1XJ68_9BACT|nr:hypothetical protein [Desulfacinum hydrothermale]SMC23548.1 hypothetical protein SAMN02746041_01755 [Desulfacinum hydrothermale DSM 13146]